MKLLILFFAVIISACANQPTSKQSVIDEQHWQQRIIHTADFDLAAFSPPHLQHAPVLSIYIEGDGRSWATRTTPSLDPTPSNPLAFKLALQDSAAVYLARPCQYVMPQTNRVCAPQYWTSHRFAPEVIAAMNAAVDELKRAYQAHNIWLIGYSGGGAVAALLAAQRDDVSALITVAGNLDTVLSAKLSGVSLLVGSLNPADIAARTTHIPQWHFVGADDQIIPPAVAQSYAKQANSPQVKVIVKAGEKHQCCWDAHWQAILQTLKD